MSSLEVLYAFTYLRLEDISAILTQDIWLIEVHLRSFLDLSVLKSITISNVSVNYMHCLRYLPVQSLNYLFL